MTYFADLTDCDYLSFKRERMLAVGWLDPSEPFPKGTVDDGLIEKLSQIVELSWSINPHWGGVHYCAIESCPKGWSVYLDKMRLGSSEILVASEQPGVYYCSPNLILHYILNHQYAAPREFVDAVLRFRPEDLVEVEIVVTKSRRFSSDSCEGYHRVKAKD